MRPKTRVMIRGYRRGALVFAEPLEIGDNDGALEVIAEKHAVRLMADDTPHMIEIEFLDEPDVDARFFRIGTDPSRMVKPKPIMTKEEAAEPPRAYAPLTPGHPAIWEVCALCGETFKAGDVTMLVPKYRADVTAAEAAAIEASLIHESCYQRAAAKIDRCVSCGEVLQGGDTKHRPGCKVQKLIDETFPNKTVQ